MTLRRQGTMDIRVHADDPRRELDKIAAAVEVELAKTRERLVRLTDEHTTGFLESVGSPWMIYRGVGYEAEPRD